ncbi:MAG: hypothetical protein ACUVWP_00345 [bacterium]
MSEKRKNYKKPRVISGKLFETAFACEATIATAMCIEVPKTGCNPLKRTPYYCSRT